MAVEHAVTGAPGLRVNQIISLWLGDFLEPETLSKIHPCDWGKLHQLLTGHQILMQHLFKQWPGWQMLEHGSRMHVWLGVMKSCFFSLVSKQIKKKMYRKISFQSKIMVRVSYSVCFSVYSIGGLCSYWSSHIQLTCKEYSQGQKRKFMTEGHKSSSLSQRC